LLAQQVLLGRQEYKAKQAPPAQVELQVPLALLVPPVHQVYKVPWVPPEQVELQEPLVQEPPEHQELQEPLDPTEQQVLPARQ
jgi:hypothetical protein